MLNAGYRLVLYVSLMGVAQAWPRSNRLHT